MHIDDLASAHVKFIENNENINGTEIWNVGTGTGTTVLEELFMLVRILLVAQFQKRFVTKGKAILKYLIAIFRKLNVT